MSDVELVIRNGTEAGVKGLKEFRAQMVEARAEAGRMSTTIREQAAITAEAARKEVEAEQAKVKVLREQIAVQKEVTSSYQRGSEARRISTKLEIDLQRRLQAAIGETAAVAGKAAKASRAGAEESGIARGAASRSGVAGTGMAAFAGPGFIAGAITAGVLDESVKLAQEQQEAQALLRNSLKDSGISWAANRAEIQATLEVEEKKTGFDKMDLEQSLQLLIRSTGSLRKAQAEEADMANIARARHTDLSGAMMLVLRASQGNTGALRRLGIDIPKVTTEVDKLKAAHLTGNAALMARAKALDQAATKEEVMAAVHKKFAGAAAAYTHTFAGETDELKNTLRDLGIQIGEKVIPVLIRLFGWLNTKGVDDLKHAYQELKQPVLDTFHAVDQGVKAFGGYKNVIELVLTGVAAWKAYKIAMEIAMVATRVQAVLTGETIDAALISTGIGALVVAVGIAAVLIIQHFQAIKTWILKFADWIAVISVIMLGPIVGGFIAAALEIIKHWNTVKRWMSDFWTWLKVTALQAALDAIEPFSHLPGRFGHWARKAKDALQTELWDATITDADRAGVQAAARFQLAYDKQMHGWAPADPLATAVAGRSVAGAGVPGSKSGVNGASVMGGATAKQSSIVGTAATAASRPGASTSYQYGGAPSLSGHTDCAGFTQAVMKANGISVARTSEGQFKQGKPIEWDKLQPGDLVFFDTHDMDAPPSHVGLYVGNGQMIHDAHTGSGIVYANLDNSYWRQNYMGARRYTKSAKGGGAGASGKPGSKPDTAAGQAAKKAAAQADAINATIDQQTAALNADINTAATTKADAKEAKAEAKAKAKREAKLRALDADKARLISLNAEIDRIEKSMPAQADAVEEDARAHLERLRKSLHPGMSASELAKVRAEIAKWGKVLKDEIRKQASEAKKAAELAKKEFDDAWAEDTAKIDRGIAEAWAIKMRDFQRETSRNLQAMARAAQAGLQVMQRQFQSQMTAFDRQTQAGLASLAAPAQTPTEKLLADRAEAQTVQGLQDALATAQASGDPKQIAQAQYDIETHALEKQAALERTAADKAAAAAQDKYQEQRDALKQALEDQEAAREQAYQDQADAAAQAYQDERDAQQQALQDQHDDQVRAFDAELQIWGIMIATKQKTWAEFLAWLAANPATPGGVGSQNEPTNPGTNTSPATVPSGPIYAPLVGNDPNMPKHAAGGIHWRPSVGMLGDQGPEATLPLTGQRGQEVVSMLAKAIAAQGGGGDARTIIYGTFLGATERQVARSLEGLVTPQQGRVVRYKAPF